MAKYKITTEAGTFIVETEDAPPVSRGTVTVDQAKAEFDRTRTRDDRTTGQVIKDSALNNLEGVGQFVAGIPGMFKEGAAMLSDTMSPASGGAQRNLDRFKAVGTGMKDAVSPLANDTAALFSSKYAPSTPEQQRGYQNLTGQNLGAALTGAAVKATPSITKALGELVPSKARAGANFQAVMSKARNVPLNLQFADDAALRAQELAGRGALPGRGHSMPKVMRDYLRTRESTKGMTYEVGRDFQSSAGKLSVAESLATKGPMKAEVSKLAKALAESNREAAKKVGMGAEYDAAMSEYRRAARIANILDAVKKNAPKAAIGSGVGYGLYKALGNN